MGRLCNFTQKPPKPATKQPELPFDTDRDPGDEDNVREGLKHFKPMLDDIKRELDEMDDED